jgi:uncharacterized YigZ family protein
MNDCYSTIARPASSEIKVKGSRFIGRTVLASSVEQATAELDAIRKQEYAATHNCYAYLVGLPDDTPQFKFSDDGEPGGTAGRPIYDVVSGSGLTNLLLVVTRYFGGTKLGTGGLVKAYGETAQLVLKQSGAVERFLTDSFKVEIDFSLYDPLIKRIHQIGAVQDEAEFSDRVTMTVTIRRSLADTLEVAITELSAGRAHIEKIEPLIET